MKIEVYESADVAFKYLVNSENIDPKDISKC